MRVGSLFSGIGGIELGLERAGGFCTEWVCEVEPYPSAVLAERFPFAPNIGDITKVDWAKVPRVDVLTGGFPCQDVSFAGKRKGLNESTRTSLWRCYRDAIRALRPRLVIAENVPGLLAPTALGGGAPIATVLGELSALGYDAEWHIVSARSVGAPHRRDRVFIVAYSNNSRHFLRQSQEQSAEGRINAQRELESGSQDVADAYGERQRGRSAKQSEQKYATETQGRGTPVPDSDGFGLSSRECDWEERQVQTTKVGQSQEGESERDGRKLGTGKICAVLPNTDSSRKPEQLSPEEGRLAECGYKPSTEQWKVEPRICRVVNGISRGLDSYIWKERVKALGNAVVPQVAQFIGERINAARGQR